jgi:hypothetical protein
MSPKPASVAWDLDASCTPTMGLRPGYKIKSKGHIAWTDMPSIGLAIRIRGRFLVLEALFAKMFRAVTISATD